VLAAKLTGTAADVPPAVETVVWQIRLPRVLAAVVVGAALAASGAAYQGMFRNPLVSPDILGVSAGAGLGAALGIFLSLPVVAIQALAFLGGLLAVLSVYIIGAAVRRHDPLLVLVLTGIAIGTLLGAAISLVKVLADPYDQLPAITFWLLGSLTAITRGDLMVALPVVLFGLIPLHLLRWRMNLLTLGEDEARALGVSTGWLRAVFIASATLMTSASVAIAGIVGWIGLLIPHAARLLVGPDFARLLPASLMPGGGFLVAVDALARTIAAIEVPLGILTAVIGAPFFLWLLATARRVWA
jgi:iron complex transport system permease protein